MIAFSCRSSLFILRPVLGDDLWTTCRLTVSSNELERVLGNYIAGAIVLLAVSDAWRMPRCLLRYFSYPRATAYAWDVMTWQHFLHYWSSVKGIHLTEIFPKQRPVDSPNRKPVLWRFFFVVCLDEHSPIICNVTVTLINCTESCHSDNVVGSGGSGGLPYPEKSKERRSWHLDNSRLSVIKITKEADKLSTGHSLEYNIASVMAVTQYLCFVMQFM